MIGPEAVRQAAVGSHLGRFGHCTCGKMQAGGASSIQGLSQDFGARQASRVSRFRFPLCLFFPFSVCCPLGRRGITMKRPWATRSGSDLREWSPWCRREVFPGHDPWPFWHLILLLVLLTLGVDEWMAGWRRMSSSWLREWMYDGRDLNSAQPASQLARLPGSLPGSLPEACQRKDWTPPRMHWIWGQLHCGAWGRSGTCRGLDSYRAPVYFLGEVETTVHSHW